MDEQDYRSMILHYGREKFYHTMHTYAVEAVTKYPGDQSFRLLNGIALVLGNRVQEAIRELTPMQNDREINLPTILALIYGHKRCAVVDKEAIISLDQKMKEERKMVTFLPVYYAAVFLFLSGKLDKAREYADKALKMNSSCYDALILRGWVELSTGVRIDDGVLELFEKGAQKLRSLDAYLGQVRYYQITNDYESAIALLNKLAVKYTDQKLPLVEKMKTELSNWRWENAKETAIRILNLDPTNIDAQQVKCLIVYCNEGNVKGCAAGLEGLFSAIRKVEPANAELFLQVGQLFTRIGCNNLTILDQSVKFVEKASQLSPTNARYLTELGFVRVQMGDTKEAVKYFKQATKVDDSATEALCGLTLCQLTDSGPSEQVAQQIEFLTEVQGQTQIPLILLMSARMHSVADQKISFLIQACEAHIKNLRTVSFGTDYLRLFNPTFLIEVAVDLLQLCPMRSAVQSELDKSAGFLHISLRHTLNILEMVVKACPGLVRAVNLLAKVQFLSGDLVASLSTLQKILQDIDPTNTDAHLLIAQIHIQQGQFNRAKQSLEICLGHSFQVRENPMYHLLNGIVQRSVQQNEEALKSFDYAIRLIDMGEIKKLSISEGGGRMNGHTVGLSDLVTLYLEMAKTHTALNQQPEAAKLMEEAMKKVSGSPEEGRLVIANADLMMTHGRVDQALGLLGNIQCGEPYYVQAKTKMAEIYMMKKKDRLAFAQCFKELVDNCPGPESYLMLGEAYMSIQEPDKALEAYKAALKERPNDAVIAREMGRAYVKTHHYAKAIAYYKEATKNPEHVGMKLDLAELYLKLKQFPNAEKTLLESIEEEKLDSSDLEALQYRTKQLLLLASVREKSGHLLDSIRTLREARDNQGRIHKRISVEQAGGVSKDQQLIMAKICTLLAEQSINVRDNDQAVQFYKEAIKSAPQDVVLLTALAKLHMQMNVMDQCQQVCGQILQMDSTNEAASVMMADLSFRKMDFESAAYHFSQLLLSQPTYWTALARLIEVNRRSGTTWNAAEFVKRGEQNCAQPEQEAGLNFCKGLYEWYMGNPNTALRLFNNARKDAEWGKQAIFNMIEICINPDGDLPNEAQIEGQTEEVRESQMMALRTAERLLKELQPRPGAMDNETLNYKLLDNFIILAMKQKHLAEQALQSISNIAGQDEYRDHVGPILGLATAYVMLKQSQRAKNQLKRVAKNAWSFEDAEYLERCWLLLADQYLQAGKLDMASELLTRVLEHNRSCVKAWEMCGLISEKEAVPKVAAGHYEKAWKFSGKSKQAIGYRLAYNFMKAKRYPDAIDVCQQVLKINPAFLAIKKDILDKSRSNLKL